MTRFILLFSVFSFFACKANDPGNQSALNKSDSMPVNASGKHVLLVKEVLQAEAYTYVLGTEEKKELWIATSSIKTKPGDTVYFEGGMEVHNFQSKLLNRSFETILFVEKVVFGSGQLPENNKPEMPADAHHAPVNIPVQKDTVIQPVKSNPSEGEVNIQDLFKNPSVYQGKTIRVRGKITKYTPAVMGQNWIHLQDGSSYKGKNEIVITTNEEASLGAMVTFEGKITLNKDLGYGYFFEVLMEQAKRLK